MGVSQMGCKIPDLDDDVLEEWYELLDWAEHLPTLPARWSVHKLLSARQEQTLAKVIQHGLDARKHLDRYPIRRLHRFSERATRGIHILVCANLRLARSQYRVPQSLSMNYDDLFQYCILGLMRAAEKFQPGIGRFSTYAVWWIRQTYSRGIDNDGNLIRLPIHVLEKWRNYSRLMNSFDVDEFAPPDPHLTKLTLSDHALIERIQLVLRPMVDVDEIGNTFVEHITSTPLTPEERLLHDDMEQNVKRHLQEFALNGTLRRGGSAYRAISMLIRRIGIYDGHEWTLDEIGQEFDVTRERVRQILNSLSEDPAFLSSILPILKCDANGDTPCTAFLDIDISQALREVLPKHREHGYRQDGYSAVTSESTVSSKRSSSRRNKKKHVTGVRSTFESQVRDGDRELPKGVPNEIWQQFLKLGEPQTHRQA